MSRIYYVLSAFLLACAGISKAPTVHGFHCVELRQEPEHADYLGLCYRTTEQCNRARDEQSSSAAISECQWQSHAYCFPVKDTENKRMWEQCFATVYRCRVERARSRGEESESLRYEPCKKVR